MTKLNGKELKIVATAGFNNKYGGLEAACYTRLACKVLEKYPVDMLVFGMADKNHLQIRCAGYYMYGKFKGVLDKETVAYKSEFFPIRPNFPSDPIEIFWFIVIDYGDYYNGTFRFPDEY